ncbi:uncharacterized protein [Haliotis cracherodii]|uniref:uncharacterized protein n=1 Tax=Haliotis cracherodii TaxID=6455 RepID=UPI0039EB4B03
MRFSILPRHDTLLIVFIISLVAVPSFLMPKVDPEKELTESKYSRDESITDSIGQVGSDQEVLKEEKELDDHQRQYVKRDNGYKSLKGEPVQSKEQDNQGPMNDEIHEAQIYDSGIYDKGEETHAVHVILKSKKEHIKNGTHKKVDKTVTVRVSLKDKEHENQTDSQSGIGQGPQSQLKKKKDRHGQGPRSQLKKKKGQHGQGPRSQLKKKKGQHGQGPRSQLKKKKGQHGQGPRSQLKKKKDRHGQGPQSQLKKKKDRHGQGSQSQLKKKKDRHGQGSQSQLKRKKDRHGQGPQSQLKKKKSQHGQGSQSQLKKKKGQHGQGFQSQLKRKKDRHGQGPQSQLKKKKSQHGQGSQSQLKKKKGQHGQGSQSQLKKKKDQHGQGPRSQLKKKKDRHGQGSQSQLKKKKDRHGRGSQSQLKKKKDRHGQGPRSQLKKKKGQHGQGPRSQLKKKKGQHGQGSRSQLKKKKDRHGQGSRSQLKKKKDRHGQGSRSQLKKKKDRHNHNSKTAEDDGVRGMYTSGSVLIPQDTVKVEDLHLISTEVKRLDTAVNTISCFVRKMLGNIQKNLLKMAKMVPPIAPSNMSHMIQVAVTKTEKDIKKLCLKPIQKGLRIRHWGAWSSWGTCSLTCGSGGYKVRHRQCQSKSHHHCLGNNVDLSHCVLQKCPAKWLSWGQWTPCSSTCGHGHQMRSRTCLTSSEKVHCEGSTSDMKDCFSNKCADSHNKAILGHIRIQSKSSNPTNTSSDGWSTWSEWTRCKQCWKGNRKRTRMCLNSQKQPLYNKTLCPGARKEIGKCVGSACNHDNAVYVSEGQSVKLKCPKPRDMIPTRVFWITPRKQRIKQHSHNKRIHMFGSSLLVDDARYADQGIYSCIVLTNNYYHIVQITLLAHTCKTHHCRNGGTCNITRDPEFDGILNYKCICTGMYKGPFCLIRSLNVSKYIGPMIILIVLLMLVLALALFLLRRSLRQAKIDSLGENLWKKEGTLQTEKKIRFHKTEGNPVPMERPDDKGDISNASIVSNDGSFVEITEHDYVDLDAFDLSQEEKNPRGGYQSGRASDGYEGKFLKYPSPPYKNKGQNYAQKEFDYITMDSFQKRFSTHPNNPAGVYDDGPTFQDVSSGNIENFYENLSSEQRDRPFYPPPLKSEQEYIETLKYKGSLKQGKASIDREAFAQETVEIVAKNLARQCLVEIESETQNPTKVVPTALNSSQMRSDAPGPNKYQPHGRPGTPNTNMPDISAVNSKSPKRKTKTTQKEETANLQTKPLNTVSQNTLPGDVSDPEKDNRPDVKKEVVIPPVSQGFRQQLLTPTEGRIPMVSRNRNPEDTTRQSQVRSPVSPTRRRYVFPMTLSVKDKQQEAEFLKHFATSFSSQPVSPTTSTPKKVDKIACMNVIMPSDIMTSEEDDSQNLGKKGQSGEIMVVTSSKVLGKKEQEPVTRGRGNISSNNRQSSASEMSSGSEVFSDSYYQSLSQVSVPTGLSGESFCALDTSTVVPTDLSGGSRFRTLDTSTARPTDLSGGCSFRTLDRSMSLQTMPDLDNTVSFPKLTVSYHEDSLGQARPRCPSTPGQDGSLFQGEITEGSVYLSDYNYTQGTPDELSESQCSSDHTSDDDEEEEEEEEEDP